ncbi:MAG: alanine racemase [Clostridiales bacterium]|nr:alanine racemase [Clostridiales bacterium]
MKALIVEKEKIKHNIEKIRERAENAQIIAVLKGNGYGLGLCELAETVRDAGISSFAVTEPEDALKLRNAGFADEEILVLRSTALDEDINLVIEACATATVGSYDAAVALNGLAEKQGLVIDAHLELDTGMGRFGFLISEMDRILSVYKYMSNINITGLYTHLSCAFANKKMTEMQIAKLQKTAERIKEEGLNPGTLHALNSAALFKQTGLTKLDAVRVGSAITGRVPAKCNHELKRTGYLSCPICEIRWLPAKHSIGYGAAYVTKKPTKIAVIPLGYSDGFALEKTRDIYRFRDMLRYMLAELKKWTGTGRIYVSLNGRRARVLGHVGMGHTIIDVTNIECKTGDIVSFDVSPLYVGAQVPRSYV